MNFASFRDEPTLLITHDLATPARGPVRPLRLAVGGFHLDALTSGVPLNVDLDTTLTVVAGNLYRLLARTLSRYETATPDRIWRDFLDATGNLHIDAAGVTCALNLRSHHPHTRSSSTPGSATLKHRSRGGTAANCGSGSRHDDHQNPGNLNSIT